MLCEHLSILEIITSSHEACVCYLDTECAQYTRGTAFTQLLRHVS